MPVEIDDNQKESNTKKMLTISTISTFLYNNYDNVSDDDRNIGVRGDEFSEEIDEENLFFPTTQANNTSNNNNDNDVEIEFLKNITNFVNVTNISSPSSFIHDLGEEDQIKVKEESITSVNKNNNISKMDEINVSYTRKKSEHIKKLLENKSHRSRVNSVFELSSKMMFNSTINNSYRNARAGKVSLLGLFELTTQNGARPEGVSEVYAAELAVKHINDRNILPGYTLELLTNDTKVGRTIFLLF